jgi:hypothetical protein
MNRRSKQLSSKGVFISWTKPLGLRIARQLRTFLKSQVPGIDFFVSQDDLIPGQPWRAGLERRLQEDSLGILVITPAALTAPWIFYEAGAISAKADAAIVPLLFDVPAARLKEPIGAYQSLPYSEDSILRIIGMLQGLDGELSKGLEKRKPRGFSAGWKQFNSEIQKLLGEDLRFDRGPQAAGNYAFYMLKMRDPETQDLPKAHRAHLRLGMDGSESLRAHFRNYFDEYRGSWHQEGNLVSVELSNVMDQSDRLFFLLKHSGSWMWGVYCGLASGFSSVAGRCFLDGKRRLLSKISPARMGAFISLAQSNKETQHGRLKKVSDYLELPIGPTLHCKEPISY